MKPWDIYTWTFPGAESHPAVILGTESRLANKPKVNVLFCSSRRSTRTPEVFEMILDHSDGLDWETLCKCDLIFAVFAGSSPGQPIFAGSTHTLVRFAGSTHTLVRFD
jgi:hypothetical protein